MVNHVPRVHPDRVIEASREMDFPLDTPFDCEWHDLYCCCWCDRISNRYYLDDLEDI